MYVFSRALVAVWMQNTQLVNFDFERQGEEEREREKTERLTERKTDRQEWSGWRIVSVFAVVVVLWCGVCVHYREITGCRRCLLTFAVHHTVVFVVFRSLPSHIQQPPGACAQHHRDRALRLLDGDR